MSEIKADLSGGVSSDQSEESTSETESKTDTPQAKWEYRTNLKIHSKMSEIIKLTVNATEAQVEQLKRKLEKLQYGSLRKIRIVCPPPFTRI